MLPDLNTFGLVLEIVQLEQFQDNAKYILEFWQQAASIQQSAFCPNKNSQATYQSPKNIKNQS